MSEETKQIIKDEVKPRIRSKTFKIHIILNKDMSDEEQGKLLDIMEENYTDFVKINKRMKPTDILSEHLRKINLKTKLDDKNILTVYINTSSTTILLFQEDLFRRMINTKMGYKVNTLKYTYNDDKRRKEFRTKREEIKKEVVKQRIKDEVIKEVKIVQEKPKKEIKEEKEPEKESKSLLVPLIAFLGFSLLAVKTLMNTAKDTVKHVATENVKFFNPVRI